MAHARPLCVLQERQGPPSRWLHELLEPEVGGLILSTNGLELADLRALTILLTKRPEFDLLLLVGDRGLAGAEGLLARRGAVVLPKPLTPRALQIVLAYETGPDDASPPHPTPPSPPPIPPDQSSKAATPPEVDRPADPLLDQDAEASLFEGMVDGLRDPLASLSGHLQILRAESASAASEDPSLGAALEAAAGLDQVVQLIHLASGAARVRSRTIELPATLKRIAKQWEQNGYPATLALGEIPGHIQADPKLIEAALSAGRLLLERFGPGGTPSLECRIEDAHLLVHVSVEQPEPPESSRLSAPPDLLPRLLARLAGRLQAEPLLDLVADVIPWRAGLRWRSHELADPPE